MKVKPSTMRHPFLICVTALSFMLLAACGRSEPAEEPAPEPVVEADPEWLTIVQGVVTGIDENRIVLAANPSVMAFTDRPQRRVGSMSLDTYVANLWSEGGAFVMDPPNASLVINEPSEDRTAVVTLTSVLQNRTTLLVGYEVLEGNMPIPGDHLVLVVDGTTDVSLNYVNQSDDQDNSSVVIFQRNDIAAQSNEQRIESDTADSPDDVAPVTGGE